MSMPTIETELMDQNSITNFTPSQLYSISKLANCLHVVALDKILKESDKTKNIKIVAIRPGFVRGTQLGRFTSPILQFLAFPLIWFISRNLDDGISTILHCIRCPYNELVSGKLYYNNCLFAYKDFVTIESAINLFHESDQVVNTILSKPE